MEVGLRRGEADFREAEVDFQEREGVDFQEEEVDQQTWTVGLRTKVDLLEEVGRQTELVDFGAEIVLGTEAEVVEHLEMVPV